MNTFNKLATLLSLSLLLGTTACTKEEMNGPTACPQITSAFGNAPYGNKTFGYSIAAKGENLKYTWDFGDGTGPKLTNSTDVEHHFTKPGTYIVKASVSNACGIVATTFKTEVTGLADPVVAFTVGRDPQNPLVVTVNNTTINAENQVWKLYDATTGQEYYTIESNTLTQFPALPAGSNGLFKVSLAASNSNSPAGLPVTPQQVYIYDPAVITKQWKLTSFTQNGEIMVTLPPCMANATYLFSGSNFSVSLPNGQTTNKFFECVQGSNTAGTYQLAPPTATNLTQINLELPGNYIGYAETGPVYQLEKLIPGQMVLTSTNAKGDTYRMVFE